MGSSQAPQSRGRQSKTAFVGPEISTGPDSKLWMSLFLTIPPVTTIFFNCQTWSERSETNHDTVPLGNSFGQLLIQTIMIIIVNTLLQRFVENRPLLWNQDVLLCEDRNSSRVVDKALALTQKRAVFGDGLECLWLFMALYGCLWLFVAVAVYGCLWLFNQSLFTIAVYSLSDHPIPASRLHWKPRTGALARMGWTQISQRPRPRRCWTNQHTVLCCGPSSCCCFLELHLGVTKL